MNINLMKKDKKCSHKIITEKLTKKSKAYFYCYKCGKLIIVKDLYIYESFTKGKLEFNPIKMINQMLLKQKEEIKWINEKYKNNINDNNIKSNIYIKNRDIFILYLKQLCNKMNYKENTFYHCLYLLDSYLINVLKKEITKRTIFLIVLGFFLISSKFTEDDIFEPNINRFCKINKDLVVSQSEILNMEIKCLQIINYNMINYSIYDWIKIFNKVGIIFNTNTNNINIEHVYEKQKYLLKRIINSDILYRYNSFNIALSIIHISIDNIFVSNKLNKDLFELFLSIFNYKFSDYENCYVKIKSIIFNYNNNNKNYEIENNKTESNKKNLNTCYNKSMENILKHPIKLTNFDKKIINNSQSKKIILYLNNIIYKNINKSGKILTILKNKTENDKNKINIEQNFKKEIEKNISNDNLILPKTKLLFQKEKQHLTIDCNNIETIKNNKMNENNYNNIINYLLNKTKKENNSYREILNNKNLVNSKSSSRNIIYSSSNNEISNKNSDVNKLIKNEFKKSLTSFSNSPINKNRKNILKQNKFSLLYNLNYYKNKNILNNLNINMINNNIESNKSIKTFYNKNPIKTFILNKEIFSSSKNWKNKKNLFLRNSNNNFINSNNNIKIDKEKIPPIKNGLMNISNN